MIRVLVKTDTRYPVNRKIIRRAVFDTLSKYKAGESDTEVSVAVVGIRKMDKLTSDFKKDAKVHEVLSFPFEDVDSASGSGFISVPDGVLRLGDIILCWPQVLLAAARDGVMVDDEVYLLVSHSVEHLLGRHHE